MAYYLVREKGTLEPVRRFSAESIEHLQFDVDGDWDDAAAFEFTEARKREAKRNWRSLIPVGETCVLGMGSMPAVVAGMPVFAEVAKRMGNGRSE